MSAYDRAPFRWSEQQRDTLPVELKGRLPSWLRGQLMRTAPAVFERSGWQAGHLFDGLSLMYGFSFDDQVSFRQCLLQSKTLAKIDGGTPIGGFATTLRRSFLKRLMQPIPPMSDNTNVNILPYQQHWLALTESPAQHRIDSGSLASRGLVEYQDELPRLLLMSAHPQLDPRGNGLVNVGTEFGRNSAWWVFRQPLAGGPRVVEGKLPLPRVPYLHSFGVTARSVVLIDQPLTVNPMRMLFSNRGYIDHFRWKPERGTKLWKLDRNSGTFNAYETEPLFCFHTVATFEDGDDVVLDFLTYEDASLVDAFRTESLGDTFPTHMPTFKRARLSPTKRHVELETLSRSRFEFPVLPSQNATSYGQVWGVHVRTDDPKDWSLDVVRLELEADRLTRFSEPSMAYGEPVFVRKPDGQSADDGVLLAVGHHLRRDLTVLAVLDARTLEPLARCEVQLSLPLGFHGSFRADPGNIS